MSDKSAISWCDASWPIVVGCTRVSDGCTHCYAERLAHRLGENFGQAPYKGLATKRPDGSIAWTRLVRCLPERLDWPLKWRAPRRVFVTSMGDLFHEDVPDEFIAAVWGVMAMARRHTFQVLTKRPERAVAFMAWLSEQQAHRAHWIERVSRAEALCGEPRGSRGAERCPVECIAIHDLAVSRGIDDRAGMTVQWPLPNVWLGTSVEDQAAADERIPHLLATPAAVRFLSCEPLLGPIDLTACAPYVLDGDESNPGVVNAFNGMAHHPLTCIVGPPFKASAAGVSWVISGGESGPGFRPMDPDWARSLRDQSAAAGIAYFHKQASGPRPGMGRELDGQLHEAFPTAREAVSA